MGSQRQATQPQGNPPLRIMDINLDFLKPLYELVQNEEVQRKMEETARLYWSPDVDSNTVTVNLIPSVIALIVAALIALPLLGTELHPPITELPPPAMAPLPTATDAATSRSMSRALLIYSSRWPIFKGPPTTLLVKELRTQMESVTHHKRVP